MILQQSSLEKGSQEAIRAASCVRAGSKGASLPRCLLVLEDYEPDMELLRRHVCSVWPCCDFVGVNNEESFKAGLGEPDLDLIIADYSLPGFDGLSALALAKEKRPRVPFIFVSGAIGDDTAVECLKAGATDYVLKDRLAKLVPAIERALKEAEEAERSRQMEEKRKQAEAARRDSELRLEKANRDLLRRNEEIQKFYHTLSHELKTPLTAAREFVSIVKEGLAGPLSQAQVEYLGIAQTSCEQLRRCIDDLLDATRLETGKLTLDLKLLSPTGLIEGIVNFQRQRALTKDIALIAEVPPALPELPMDEFRITQVITNLLNNAIKYTPEGGLIVVKAGDAPNCPDLLQISVTDSGPGIPPEDQERIFERLYQVKVGDAATEQGIGLGLYLCRELVQLHGGSIRVESKPGKGSTFSFVLPKDRSLLYANVLVVDDDASLLQTIRWLLSAQRYNVRTARDGIEALHLMRRQTPDIVILDLAMPRLNGPALMGEIRKHWGALPVVIHTAQTEGELMKQTLAFCPFTLLAKPCSPQQLIETLRKVQRSEDTAIWKRNHHGLPRL